MVFHAEMGALDDSLDPTGSVARLTLEEARTIADILLDDETLSCLQERNHPARRKAVLALRDAGLSHRQIAEVTGIPSGSISTLLHTHTH